MCPATVLLTDELSFPDDIILDVMLLAQKMLIHRVLNHCLLHVRHNLSPRNVVNWWMWADEHNGFGELRATAFSYLVRWEGISASSTTIPINCGLHGFPRQINCMLSRLLLSSQ
eukprot:GHUV01054887.1.p1 GENE.GHUV01054887.1~~GHUV01054887.1.p1  ORF type:complete len:114 (-),score=24.62 GHUV01054887.1:354-695(-)